MIDILCNCRKMSTITQTIKKENSTNCHTQKNMINTFKASTVDIPAVETSELDLAAILGLVQAVWKSDFNKLRFFWQ